MRRAMGTVHHKKVCLDKAQRPQRLAAWGCAASALLLAACASVTPRAVPPPPGLSTATSSSLSYADAGRQAASSSRLQPPKLKRIDYPPGTVPPPLPGRLQTTPLNSSPAPQAALVSPPVFVPGAPVVYRAPSPRTTSPNYAAPPSVAAPSPAPYTPVLTYSEPVTAPASVGSMPASPVDFDARAALQAPVSQGHSAAITRIPTAASSGGFVIGAGDTVQIDVLGRPELSAKGNVAADGRVTVALVGAVNIGGLSPVQAAERIGQAYREGQYLVSPQVTVTLVDYQSQLLTVLGEVRTPGRFPLRTRLSVLDGLALAGGINEQGSSTAYLLRPEDSVVTRYEIDLDALIQAGAGQQYFEMLAGDTLVVPRTEVFYIYGEARNPNSYKLKPGMTVIQALSLAGGLTDKGSDKRIDIRRRDESGRLRTLAASLNEPLQADDVVYVRERLF